MAVNPLTNRRGRLWVWGASYSFSIQPHIQQDHKWHAKDMVGNVYSYNSLQLKNIGCCMRCLRRQGSRDWHLTSVVMGLQRTVSSSGLSAGKHEDGAECGYFMFSEVLLASSGFIRASKVTRKPLFIGASEHSPVSHRESIQRGRRIQLFFAPWHRKDLKKHTLMHLAIGKKTVVSNWRWCRKPYCVLLHPCTRSFIHSLSHFLLLEKSLDVFLRVLMGGRDESIQRTSFLVSPNPWAFM